MLFTTGQGKGREQTENLKMELQKIDQKQIQPIKESTSKILADAKNIVIKTNEDLVSAADVRAKVKQKKKEIEDIIDGYVKPAKEIVQLAKNMFDPFLQVCKDAEAEINKKVLDFQLKEEKKAEVKTETVMAKVAEGKMSVEKASEKIENLTPQNTVKGSTGKVQFFIHRDIKIVDEKKIPAKYFKLDLVAVRRDVLSGIEVPGVEITEEKRVR